MSLKFSVVVCVYNCSNQDLQMTLQSILMQNFNDFEIIIADDCSENDYHSIVEEELKSYDYVNYCYLRNQENVGTVKNVIHALEHCSGKYIKLIGCGDLLFSEDTLKHVYDYMENNCLSVCFGNGIAYTMENNDFYVRPFYSPNIKKPYSKNNSEAILRNLIVFNDQISGAITFHSKEILITYLNIIKDKIIYVEDCIPKLIALDGKEIGYLNENLVLYQYGTGISTSQSKSVNWRIINDEQSFNQILFERYSSNKYVKTLHQFLAHKEKNSILRLTNKIKTNPYYAIYYIFDFYHKKLANSKWMMANDLFDRYKGDK